MINKPKSDNKDFSEKDFDNVLRKMLETPPEPKQHVKASRDKKLGKVIPAKE